MSLSFGANQYDDAFYSKKLQNWQVACEYRQRPRAFDGFTQIIANNRGHLKPGVKRSVASPWGNFVGTWDMPLRIPGNVNPTARSGHAIDRLLRSKTDGEIILNGKLKKCKVPDPLPIKEDVKADKSLDPLLSQQQLIETNGLVRSGARNPEPLSTSPKIPPIASRQQTPKALTPKPCTPTLDWPKPQSPARSAGSRRSQKLATPTQQAVTNAAVAGSPEPELQGLTADITWPSPKEISQEKA